MNSKKIIFAALAVFAATNLVLPASVFAQTAPKGFCSTVSTISSKIDQRIANTTAKIETKRTDIINNITKRQSEKVTRRAENRAKQAQIRDPYYAKLEEKATNETQKQAVATFKSAVENASNVRWSAIDAALQTFDSEVKSALVQRKSSVDAVINAYRSSISAATEKAEADCAAGTEQKTVRATFQQEMKAARDKFQADKQTVEKVKGSLQTQRDNLKTATNKAMQDFKTAMEKARTDLKAAFQQQIQ